jgi:hypothetical protein
MKDEDRQLIEHILNAAGTAGIQGFHYMVRYQLIGGITEILGGGVLLALSIAVFRMLMAWKVEDDDAHIPRGFAIVAVCGLTIAWVFILFSGLQDALAPEGAAIVALLHH